MNAFEGGLSVAVLRQLIAEWRADADACDAASRAATGKESDRLYTMSGELARCARDVELVMMLRGVWRPPGCRPPIAPARVSALRDATPAIRVLLHDLRRKSERREALAIAALDAHADMVPGTVIGAELTAEQCEAVSSVVRPWRMSAARAALTALQSAAGAAIAGVAR